MPNKYSYARGSIRSKRQEKNLERYNRRMNTQSLKWHSLDPMKPLRCIDTTCNNLLLYGPRGGSSVNMACHVCFKEYNVAFHQGMPVMAQDMGKLSVIRGKAVFGLDVPPYI